ncbi:hypothetical protein N7490_000275 [Penicillium lividum]|nr:hypothetical protein N7490_000275 [Penicillium lividum]
MLAFLPLLLAFSSLAGSAAIPSSIQSVRDSSWEPTDFSRVPTQSANQKEVHNLVKTKITPYYSETMPDNDEITDQLTALRESGFEREKSMHGNQAHGPQQSIGTPDTTIDTRTRMRNLPDWELNTDLARSLESSYLPRTQDIQNSPVIGQSLRIDWIISEAPILISTPPIIPSLMFLFFIAAVLCIATVVRGIRDRH